MADPVRVLIAEDSPLFAIGLREVVEEDPGLEVCGVAVDGAQAVELVHQLKPDLVTMDVRMPRLDGLSAIERIMSERPTPILVMTADPRGETGELAVEALRRGALDLIRKPLDWPPDPREARAFRERIKLLASVTVVRHRAPRSQATRQDSIGGAPVRIVGIGASTGGPPALATLLGALPADFPVPIAVVQHLAPEFADNLVRWLDSATPLDVVLATEGMPLRPGRVVVAAGDRHLRVRAGRAALDDGPRVDGHRPSATVLFQSLARSHGAGALGLLLTGMGRDGASGLCAIRDAGGRTAAQDEESSAVWGMPRAAVELGAAGRVLGLGAIAPWLLRKAGRRQ